MLFVLLIHSGAWIRAQCLDKHFSIWACLRNYHNTDSWGQAPDILIQWVWGLARASAFLISSQVLRLLACGLPLNSWFRLFKIPSPFFWELHLVFLWGLTCLLLQADWLVLAAKPFTNQVVGMWHKVGQRDADSWECEMRAREVGAPSSCWPQLLPGSQGLSCSPLLLSLELRFFFYSLNYLISLQKVMVFLLVPLQFFLLFFLLLFFLLFLSFFFYFYINCLVSTSCHQQSEQVKITKNTPAVLTLVHTST